MNIFGVKIKEYSKKDILNKWLVALNKPKNSKPLWIVTLNPEILLEAKRDSFYKKILNSADLKIIDGIGIKVVSWLKKTPIGDRIAGVDLAEFLLKFSLENQQEIGIIYNKKGFSSEKDIRASLRSHNRIKLLGIDKEAVEKITDFKLKNCHLILVALGHPHQEKFIYNNLANFKRARVVIGIGGTLDFWTKKQTRAPKILRKFGMEWAWRLIKQPNRFIRIFKAVLIFPILALIDFKPISNSQKIK